MKVVVIFEFDEIADVNGTDADHAVGLINHSCNRWDTEVNASRVYIDDAYQEVSDESVYTMLDRIVTLHEMQAPLEDIDVEVAKARVLLSGGEYETQH